MTIPREDGRSAEQMRPICARPAAPSASPINPPHARQYLTESIFAPSFVRVLTEPTARSRSRAVVKTGVISQAAGSAYVELDKTKVMCGVYGPRQGGPGTDKVEFDRGRLDVDVKLATFATSGPRGKVAQGDAEREFSSIVHRALSGAVMTETFPKTTVDVFATVLEANGSELCATIAAASAALCEAGVAMRDLVSACTVTRNRRTTTEVPGGGAEGGAEGGGADGPNAALLLDPARGEEAAAEAGVTLAYMCRLGEASQVVATGTWDGESLDDAVQLAASGCARVDAALREALRSSVPA